mgnify:CR=1 FL=1|jgi:hypothetical protein
MRAMLKSFLTNVKRRLGLIPKDFSIGGYDYNRMLRANVARNDENTSAWSPGALNRSVKEAKRKAKEAKKYHRENKHSIVYKATQTMKRRY